MNKISKFLTEKEIGEEVSESYHYPSYTKGCWGQPGRRKCLLCKFRAPIKILSIARRKE